jgi:hypothetical protein
MSISARCGGKTKAIQMREGATRGEVQRAIKEQMCERRAEYALGVIDGHGKLRHDDVMQSNWDYELIDRTCELTADEREAMNARWKAQRPGMSSDEIERAMAGDRTPSRSRGQWGWVRGRADFPRVAGPAHLSRRLHEIP